MRKETNESKRRQVIKLREAGLTYAEIGRRLAMTRLIPCSACESHVMETDRSCPHCGEVLRAKSRPRPGWVLFSLAMAGCPSDDVYGAPDTGFDPTTTESGDETEGTDGTEGMDDTGGMDSTDGTDGGTDG